MLRLIGIFSSWFINLFLKLFRKSREEKKAEKYSTLPVINPKLKTMYAKKANQEERYVGIKQVNLLKVLNFTGI